LRPRIDFWEKTKYGHGGKAKIYAGLKHDHQTFEKGEVSEDTPTDRKYAVEAFEGDTMGDTHASLEQRFEKFKEFSREYWLNRLNRGYSGSHVHGMYIPTMKPKEAQKVFGRTFDDFRCVILEIGRIGSMAPKIGRIYKARVTVAVGNGKGIYGVATAMDDLTTEAIVLARQQAFYNLQSVNLVEGRTIAGPVYHNYHNTYMNLRPQPAGFGIRAHRMLKRIVDVAGVKDIHITVRGPSRGSPLSKINCLLRALQEIESPQERANKTGYNVVRIDPQRGDMPKVVARPNVERGMIKLKTKPYPLTDKYMKQKLHIDFFNYSYSGLHRTDYVGNRFHNLVRFGRTGSHMSGYMEYSQTPRGIRDMKTGVIPQNFVGVETNAEGENEFIFQKEMPIELNNLDGINPKKSSEVPLAHSIGFTQLSKSSNAIDRTDGWKQSHPDIVQL